MIGHYAPLWFDMMLIMNTIQDIYQSDTYTNIFINLMKIIWVITRIPTEAWTLLGWLHIVGN